ncbi:MAG TPA: single-stranded-DNA-specific exonuclease RecJ [Chthoniobacterales bacterium]
MKPLWQPCNPPDLAAARALAATLGLPAALAPLLCRHGLSEAVAAADFLKPRLKTLSDPFLLPDMDKAVARIFQAIDAGEKIVLYGDYDVDGVTSLTMLRRMLAQYGNTAACFLPHRVDEGYGLSTDGIERCLAEHAPKLLIAVDCGTSSAREIAALASKDIDVIVLDHHECSGDWPVCAAVVNPKRNGEFGYLCSGGIVFKTCHALLKTRPLQDFDLKSFLDLAALATFADLVPLTGENRLLVRHGLARMQQSCWPGIWALMEVSGVSAPLQASDIGFRLGPRLNAAGRLGTAQAALDLLSTDDPERARALAAELHSQNSERQTIEKSTHQNALSLVSAPDAPAIVVGARGWTPGVVGIVAARLARHFHRPAIVIAFDETGLGKGSGRSITGLSLVKALGKCAPLLEKFGGHEMAAGLTIREENLPAFVTAFEAVVDSLLAHDARNPRLHLDCELSLAEINDQLWDAQAHFEPFGMANPRPTFWVRGVTPGREPVVMKEKHLRLILQHQGTQKAAVFFGGASEPLPPPPWDVAFHLETNTYRGETSLQLQITHLRPASP